MKPRRTQAEVQAHLTRLMLCGEQITAEQAASRLECDPTHTRRALSAMHDVPLVHVSTWDRHTPSGPWSAVYAWCGAEPREDAPYPRRT